MAELANDIIYDQPQQEDPKPVPKTALSDIHRAKLDSIVTQMMNNKESDAAIQAVVDDFKSKYSGTQVQATPKEPKKQPSLEFKPMSDWLSIPQGYKPMVAGAEVPIDGHTKNTGQAADRISKHLDNIDQSVHNLIYNYKEDIKGRAKSIQLGINPKETLPKNAQVAAAEKMTAQPTTVTPEEVEGFKNEMQQNGGMMRDALSQRIKDLSKTNPTEANQLKSDLYRVDAKDRPDNEKQIAKNVEGINKGELEYDPKRGLLYKPHGFFGSLALGYKQKKQAFEDYDFFTKTDNESAIIKELNSRMKDQDPDKPIDLPVGASGEAGVMLGGQPIKPIIGGALAGTLGTPLSGAAAASGISAHEMYKLAIGYGLPANYAAIKKQHPEMPDYTAYQQAKDLTEKQAVVDAGIGAAMGFVGGEAALKPSNALLQKAVKSGLTQLKEEGAKKLMEGLGVGAIGSGGQVIKNIMAQKAGLPVSTDEGVGQQLVSGVALTAGMAMLAKTPELLKPKTKNELLHSISKMPDEAINQEFNNLQEVGYITPEEMQAAQKAIKQQKDIDNSIPEHIGETDRLKIQAKIKERNLLQDQIEKVDPAYHPDLKERIKSLNEEIVNISKGSDKEGLQKLVHQEAQAGKIQGYTAELLQNATENELNGYMKDIAEQAHDPNSATMTEETFGKKIVEKAKELYPKVEEPKPLTIKSEDNAIQEPSASSVLQHPQEGIGETGGERGGMEQGEQGQRPTETHAEESQVEGQEKVGEPAKVGITHRQMDELANEYGFDTYEKSPERVREWDEQAAKKLQEPNALNDLFTKLRNGETPDKVETRMMLQYLADLKAKIEANPSNELLDQLKRTKDLFNVAGREQGKALRARQGEIPAEESLGDFLIRDMDANKGAPLTEEQKSTAINEYNEIKKTKEAFEQKAAKLEAEKAKIKAKSNIKNIEKAQGEVNKQSIINDIIKKWSGKDGNLPKIGENATKNKFRDVNEDKSQYTASGVIDKAREFYRGNELMSKVIDFVEPIVKANKHIEIDTGFDWTNNEFEGKPLENKEAAFGYSSPSGKVIINFDRIHDYNTLYETALHELVHAVTRDEINNNKAFGNELRRVLEDVRKALNLPSGETVLERAVREGIIGKDLEGTYGAVNEHELLAEVFTNKRFYDFLKGIEYKGDNMLHRIYLTIAKWFSEKYKQLAGVKKNISTDNLADYLMDLTKNVISKQQTTGGSEGEALPSLRDDNIKKIAPDVMKLVSASKSEGNETLPEITKDIYDQLKGYLPGLTEKNIHDIIAGEYTKKQTRNELQKKIYDIRTQAKLINKLEALKAGVQPKNEKQRIRRNQEIETLKQQIKELEKRPEKTEAEKLSSLKARYKKQIEELESKIAKGDYGPDEKPEPIKLDKEAQELKDKYIKLKSERERRLAEQEYKNRPLGKKLKDKVTEVLNVPRTIMASVDLSAPLRQGLVLTASHPGIATKAFVESVKQAISPARFDRWLFDLKESGYYKNVLEKSGLYVADPNNLHLSAKEEAFMTNLAEKIPVLGRLVAGSERAYVAFLNKLRVDTFTMYAENLVDKGMTPENSPQIYEGLAKFVNAATGRGDLGKLEPAAQVLNTAFFSPRLIASRINMLNPLWYAKLPKEVRIHALVDMAKMIGLGTATLTLFGMMPGVTVEADPRSTDFGKIKFGDTRYDIWGGFQQYIRLISQIMPIIGGEKKADGRIVPLGNEYGQHTRGEKIFNFFRSKLAPVPSIAVDVSMGKTAVGEEVTAKQELNEHLVPMIVNDIKDAWQDGQGPMALVYTGLPSLLGVGTTTYDSGGSGGGAGSGGSYGKSNKPSKPHKLSKTHK
jgi:hypothetical protein